ncbi:MAG: UDP-N-acetylmuramoyl-tripeptide--D-alanyl-D-alanine ligase [Bacteroidia bacterium]|jgi:UDP-N-acetylmuramoyl-tripeptide--D-alanyl-D-alanine ligase|nr:UDP-N-acetylmuramoyl-tripeptide--D-alanyl-D-alanine ligase [Bacteroidia bacterium]
MKYPAIEELYRLYLTHSVVCTDTRTVEKNSIFFALKGASFNANLFARDALAKGAALAVIDEEACYTEGCVLVRDVLDTLQQLANYHRRNINIPVIAITGSNGKTTTKELTAAVLEKKYKTLYTKGNLNNHIGVPLTVLKLTPQHQIAVIEMGANHQGEIAALCKIAEPGYGIITNIGKAHLEGFGGPEGVIKAKNELYQYIRSAGGTLFVNADDGLLMRLSENTKRITYGAKAGADCTGLPDEEDIFAKGRISGGGIEVQIESKLAGRYNFSNILAAACIGLHFGLTPFQIKEALEAYTPSNNRSQFISRGSNKIWVDTYNANPSSMKLAITNFAGMKATGKVLILGDMFELGADSAAEHQALVTLIESTNAWDAVLLSGQYFAKVSTRYQKFESIKELLKWLAANPVTGKTILLKGSRGMQMEQILEYL